jgi:hypothetical protein
MDIHNKLEDEMPIQASALNELKKWVSYFFRNSLFIISVVVLFGVGGIVYSWLQKPVYKAEMLFAIESDNSSKLGSISGLASQFIGVDLSGGNIFEGDNLIELLKTRNIVEKTLLTPINIEGKETLLIDRYIQFNELDKKWALDTNTAQLKFTKYPLINNRVRDSVVGKIIKKITNNSLKIERLDKKLSFLKASLESNDELFAKLFLETLASNAIVFYTDYKSKKAKQNLEIIQHQVDSVETLLTGNVYKIASSNDLNVNPSRQVGKAYAQRTQIDVQVNGVVYGELLKNLELSKMAVRRETPLIQIIDKPILPLEKNKLGRLLSGILFGGFGFVLIIIFLFIKKKYLVNK